MAIQFLCMACGQPIEVDDDAGNQPVTCPYCRKVVTAPAATEMNLQSRAQTASPAPVSTPPPIAMGTPGLYVAPGVIPPVGPGGLRQRSMLGWWSLAMLALSFVLVMPFAGVVGKIQQSMNTTRPDKEQIEAGQKVMAEEIKARPWVGWSAVFGMCVTPLAALTLAIVTVATRRAPRGPALATLIIMGGGLLLSCVWTFLGAAAGGGGT